jgi:uncharacterized caspase-like protein
LIVVLTFLGATASWSAAVDRRVALVIGNASYKSAAKLRNPLNDADDISVALKRVGFQVIDGRDLDWHGMRGALIGFARLLQEAEAGLFYYAGHGLQVNGKNYLVPIDAEVEDESAVALELIKLDDVVDALRNTSGVRLLVLDACRQNPFTERLIRGRSVRALGTERGLARMERSQGMLIAFSTQPNAVADDGEGRNSLFAAALVREMQHPGLEITTLFRHVAIDVNKETGGRQTPELTVSLLGDFYLNPEESDIDAWTKVGSTSDPKLLEGFIGRFPTSFLVATARARLNELAERTKERERLEREFTERQRQLREDLERAEAGLRKVTDELAQRERTERERLAVQREQESSEVGALSDDQKRHDEALRKRVESEAAEQARVERERLAAKVKDFEAEKTRLEGERARLERIMAERLARMQTERDDVGNSGTRDTVDTPLPGRSLPQNAPPVPRPKSTSLSCEELLTRAQIGEFSEKDRDALQHCR